MRKALSGGCAASTTALTIFESPYADLPQLISQVVGSTEQFSFLRDLATLATS